MVTTMLLMLLSSSPSPPSLLDELPLPSEAAQLQRRHGDLPGGPHGPAPPRHLLSQDVLHQKTGHGSAHPLEGEKWVCAKWVRLSVVLLGHSSPCCVCYVGELGSLLHRLLLEPVGAKSWCLPPARPNPEVGEDHLPPKRLRLPSTVLAPAHYRLARTAATLYRLPY